MLIVVGSDHGGYEMKESIKGFLGSVGHSVKDFGAFSKDACDFPDIAFLVAQSVARGEYERGILVDSTGVASAMVANKVCGIRAAPCTCIKTASSSREHNDANVLVLGAAIMDDERARAIVAAWLSSPFAGGRHSRRVEKIKQVEQMTMKQDGLHCIGNS